PKNLPRLPTPAWPRQISRHRHRPLSLPAHRGTPRRKALGRFQARQGNHLPLHLPRRFVIETTVFFFDHGGHGGHGGHGASQVPRLDLPPELFWSSSVFSVPSVVKVFFNRGE